MSDREPPRQEPRPPSAPEPVDRPRSRTVVNRIELPNQTIVKVLLVIAGLWLLRQLWPILLLLIVAALLAIALNPGVVWLERHGLRRGQGVMVVTLLFAAAIVGIGFLIVPPVIDEGQDFAHNLPDYVNQGQNILARNETIDNWVRENAQQGQADPQALFGGVLSYGMGIVSAFVSMVTLFVLTLYLLMDGPRLYGWIISGLSPRTRANVERVKPEITRVVSGYVVGQAITSVLFGIFTFVVLSLAGVPQPILLAVVAALLDAIPLIGATVATIPAVLLAMTVSITTGIVVLVLYLAYQQIENYIIIPRIYGKTLQISALASLLAVLIGGSLLGIVGVLLALPIAAALPSAARIWREDLARVISLDVPPEN